MKINKKIREQILKDNELSIRLASVMDCKQATIEQMARRNSGKLAHYAAVLIYKEIGFKDSEIFEVDERKSIIDAI